MIDSGEELNRRCILIWRLRGSEMGKKVCRRLPLLEGHGMAFCWNLFDLPSSPCLNSAVFPPPVEMVKYLPTYIYSVCTK